MNRQIIQPIRIAPLAFATIVCVLSGTARCEDPQLKDYTSIDPNHERVRKVDPKKDPKTGFVNGGMNTTELIRSLTEINGITIAELEASMRPDKLSRAGFLGKDERLLDIMGADNDWVIKSGLTHQELALHLRLLDLIGLQESGPFRYHGVRFRVEIIRQDGFQDSPFKDGTKTSTDVILQNLDNGEAIKYSPLVPMMVERYGFFEGKGTHFRVDPKAIVKVLSFLKVDGDTAAVEELRLFDPSIFGKKPSDPLALLLPGSQLIQPHYIQVDLKDGCYSGATITYEKVDFEIARRSLNKSYKKYDLQNYKDNNELAIWRNTQDKYAIQLSSFGDEEALRIIYVRFQPASK